MLTCARPCVCYVLCDYTCPLCLHFIFSAFSSVVVLHVVCTVCMYVCLCVVLATSIKVIFFVQFLFFDWPCVRLYIGFLIY